MVVIAVRLRSGLLLQVLSKWQTGQGSRMQSISSWLLFSTARQVLWRAFILRLLLTWDTYKCPPALSLASVCLRDGAFNHLLVLILWSQLYFSVHKLGCFTPSQGSVTSEIHTRNLLLCLRPLFLACALSSMAVLHQTMKSVPGFLAIGPFWARVLNSSIGVIQGVLGAVVLPSVGKKLSDNKLSFLVMLGLFTNCLLPAAVIGFLDTACLGNWPALWDPCRNNPEQFNRVVDKAGVLSHSVQVLSSADICNSRHARAQTTLSKCVQVALLRLQDMWLSKIVTSGVVIPASRLARKEHYSDSTQVVSALVLYFAYAIITAGHLPLLMPLLWISMSSVTLLAAVSWHNQTLHQDLKGLSITSTLSMPEALSVIIHAATASTSAGVRTIVSSCGDFHTRNQITSS